MGNFLPTVPDLDRDTPEVRAERVRRMKKFLESQGMHSSSESDSKEERKKLRKK